MTVEHKIQSALIFAICLMVLIPLIYFRVKAYRVKKRLEREFIETGKQEIKSVLSKKESKDFLKYLILGIAVVGGAVLILHILRKRR